MDGILIISERRQYSGSASVFPSIFF